MTEGEFALSAAQQRLWYMSQLEPESPFYNITLPMVLESDTNSLALYEALKALVRRHDILHTRYPLTEGRVAQEVVDPQGWRVEKIAFSVTGGDSEEKASNIAATIARYPVDLHNGPVFRAFYAPLDEGKSLLVLLTHHIATDQSSINILIQELDLIYQQIAEGKACSLAPVAPYKEYVDFESQRFEKQKQKLYDYWDRQLAKGFTPIPLPYEAPLQAIRSRMGREKIAFVENDRLQQFRTWCRKEQATEFAGLLTLWGLLIGAWSNQNRFFIATTTAFREKVKFRQALGCFINTLAIYHQFTDEQDVSSLLRLNEASIIESFEHRAMTYEKLIERNRQVHQKNIDDPVNVYIQYQPRKMSHDSRLSKRFSPIINVHNGRAKFPIIMNISDWNSYLHCTIEYEEALFSDKTITGLLNAFQHLIDLVTTNHYIAVSQIISALRHQIPVAYTPAPCTDETENNLERTRHAHTEKIKQPLRLIWQQILGDVSGGDDEDFFLAGGNSLLLTQLLWHINQRFQVSIPLREIYRRTRFDEMVSLISKHILTTQNPERTHA
ncbi:condensation domain-containing protein [Pantoea eucalypti]|uniref:condensation domain-containing protein n=1 Tax=Pantoea TaxID=53335 RepID=UPI00217614A8|nr:condensation domain-containing protein [Pantoea hericii]